MTLVGEHGTWRAEVVPCACPRCECPRRTLYGRLCKPCRTGQHDSDPPAVRLTARDLRRP